MALDGSRNEDVVFDEKGITFVIDKDLFQRVSPIKVDYVDTPMGSGLSVSSRTEGSDSCGSCSCTR
jgi:Fe-S cluster assembly iron-binding protein IscA